LKKGLLVKQHLTVINCACMKAEIVTLYSE